MVKIKALLYRIMRWLHSKTPSFDNNMDKNLRRQLVMEYTRLCFFFTCFLIVVVLPLWNTLSMTNKFFRITRFLKHRVLKTHSRFYHLGIYHNQSLQQGTFWFLVVGIFTLAGSHQDLIQIMKRMGRISVALMPPLLFLTLRPSPLPETLYLALIPIHKWISRVVVLESLLHTFFYLWYMYQKSTLSKTKKPANIYGIIAMLLFILIAVTSLKGVRRRNFRLFYYVHYVSAWATVVLLHYHARPPVPYYTFLNVAILIGQIAYRVSHTRVTTITTLKISPSLTLVEFPRDDLSCEPVLPSGHVRLSLQHGNWLQWIFHQLVPLQHPYTMASLPTDRTIKLIVRNSHFPLVSNAKYRVTGVFEPKFNFMFKVKPDQNFRRASSGNLHSASLLHSPLTYDIHARRALICVGGSAISFALPLLRVLNFNGVTVKLIWVSRDYRDLKILNHFKNNFEGMEIYVSGATGSDQDIQIDYIDPYTDSESELSIPPIESPSTEADRMPLSRSSVSQVGSQHNTISTSSPLSMDDGGLKSKNYGSTMNMNSTTTTTTNHLGEVDPNDEIDFTQAFSLRNAKSNSSRLNLHGMKPTLPSSLVDHDPFRKPSLIEAPPELEDNQNEETCLVSDNERVLKIPSGIKVFFGRPSLGEKDYRWCMEKECAYDVDVDTACQIYNEDNTYTHDLSDVVVMAAGPAGLVASTRRFATDCGLNFHEECFAV
ncbi:related to ferric reductase transmembrane component 8 [Zygosaccharomyces bailii ISA1307]|nr:related to ferric reductase transmembrane component 8 [Zygosaccharomyces bailii ISA1307]